MKVLSGILSTVLLGNLFIAPAVLAVEEPADKTVPTEEVNQIIDEATGQSTIEKLEDSQQETMPEETNTSTSETEAVQEATESSTTETQTQQETTNSTTEATEASTTDPQTQQEATTEVKASAEQNWSATWNATTQRYTLTQYIGTDPAVVVPNEYKGAPTEINCAAGIPTQNITQASVTSITFSNENGKKVKAEHSTGEADFRMTVHSSLTFFDG